MTKPRVYERIRFCIEGDVATITLDHPETRNALSWAMADELSHAMNQLSRVRALVITGAGAAFCSGDDLGSPAARWQTFGDVMQDGIVTAINPMMRKLALLRIPVIAAVNGAAVGAGTPLALIADVVIAGESAFFQPAFASFGLAPDAGASWILPRLVGRARAMEMLLFAERITAAKALEWGMIYRVAPDTSLLAEAQSVAHRLAGGPTLAFGLARQTVLAAMEGNFDAALRNEANAQRIAGASRDCAEAVAAFLNKRAPAYQGK